VPSHYHHRRHVGSIIEGFGTRAQCSHDEASLTVAAPTARQSRPEAKCRLSAPYLHHSYCRPTGYDPTTSEDRTTISNIPIADMVQDMYLKELKAYKAPPVKPSDAEGHVQKFTMPKPPPSPEEADIAQDLKAYEDQVPEVEGQAAGEGAAASEHDWFENAEEEEEEHAAAH